MIEESRVPTIGNRAAATSNDGMDGTTAGQINALTAKATVVDADITLIEDSAAGYAKKKSTFATIKEWAMDWIATFITAGTGISVTYDDTLNTLTIANTGSTYTDEQAQDAIGLMIDGTLVYVDATPLLQRAAITGHITIAAGSNAAVLGSFTKAQLDAAVSDGNVLYVGDVTQYTDEMAQDAIGAMIDTSLVYVDGTPLLTRAALTGAITASQGSNTTSLGSFTKAQLDAAVSDGDVSYVGSNVTSLDTIQGVTTLGAIINGLTSKTTPADADMTVLMDSAASNASKKLSWANLKIAMKAAFTVKTTLPITFVVNDTVAVPSGDTDYICPMFIPVPSGQVATLNKVYARINSGTSATVKLQKAGVDITGYTSLSVTTTPGVIGSGTTTFTDGQQLALIVTAVSGTPKNMSVTVFIEYQAVIT